MDWLEMLLYDPSDRRRTVGRHRGSGSVLPKFVGATLCGCPFGGQARRLAPTAFIRLGTRFFPGRLTGRVSKARESIHNDIIVRCYGDTVNT